MLRKVTYARNKALLQHEVLQVCTCISAPAELHAFHTESGCRIYKTVSLEESRELAECSGERGCRIDLCLQPKGVKSG